MPPLPPIRKAVRSHSGFRGGARSLEGSSVDLRSHAARRRRRAYRPAAARKVRTTPRNPDPSTEDVVNKGDSVRVKLLEVDSRGKMRLSRKALLDKPEPEAENN